MTEKVREHRQSRAKTHFKFFSEQFLFGSTRSELVPEERAVWVDFLCLASTNYGEVECFSRDQLAQQLLIKRELLDKSIEKFIKHGKIRRKYKKREKKEIFSIVKWEHYQADYLTKRVKKSTTSRRKRRSVKSEKSDTENPPTLHYTTLHKITEDKIKEDKTTSHHIREDESEDFDESSDVSPKSFSEGGKSFQEKEFLSLLGECPGYPFDEYEDRCYFHYALAEYPDIDIIGQLKKKIAWWKENPEALDDQSKFPRAQLDEWFAKEQEFQEKEKKANNSDF